MPFEKTYLSRAMTRAMAMDHPIGDPFGGPAYGERNDPISAVISIGTMVGTYAAAGSFAAMTLFQGLAFAGAALSLAGNITGNKSLSKIGMITGIAGGVGMLAESVMGTTIGGTLGETFGGEAASAATPLSGTPAAGPQTPVVEGVATASPIADVSPVNATALEPINGTASSINAPGGAAAPLNAPGEALTPINAPGGATSPLNGGPIANNALPGQTGYGWEYFAEGANNVPTAISPDGQYFANVDGSGMSKITGAGGQELGFGEKAWDSVKSAGSSAMDLAKSNPGAAMMMGKAVGGFTDWISGKTDAEIAALEAQVGFADARAMQIQEEIAKEKRRRANLNQGYQQVNQGIAVNQNAMITPPWQQQQQPGLIAGARTGG